MKLTLVRIKLQRTILSLPCRGESAKKDERFINNETRGQGYKNTPLPTFSRVKMWQYINAIVGIVFSGTNVIK
jgi:hypothetical protein